MACQHLVEGRCMPLATLEDPLDTIRLGGCYARIVAKILPLRLLCCAYQPLFRRVLHVCLNGIAMEVAWEEQ